MRPLATCNMRHATRHDGMCVARHLSPHRPFSLCRLLPRRSFSLVSLVAILSFSAIVSAEVSKLSFDRLHSQLSQAIASCRELAGRMGGYDVVFRRDPMRPLVDGQGQLASSAGLSGGLSVQGIIWSDQRPLAVIDDELYPAGQTVGPYAILSIQPDGVIVQRGAEKTFIPLDRGIEPTHAHPVEEPAPPEPINPQ